MSNFFQYIREVNELSVCLRLVLAVVCGGIIGLEREHKHRQAGFRTHILISVGAALATLISQFLIQESANIFPGVNVVCDPARLGAQVVAGMGFIGAGTIMVTKRRQVKGLTTAAGLWTTAIIGLSAGVGFYEITLFASFLLFITETIFSKFEWMSSSKARSTNIFIECESSAAINAAVEKLESMNVKIGHMEISKANSDRGNKPCAILGVYFGKKKFSRDIVLATVSDMPGIIAVEEL